MAGATALQQENAVLDNDTLFDLVIKPLESIATPQSHLWNLFLFIDDLLKNAEEKQLKMVDTLLQESHQIRVSIRPSKSVNAQYFVKKMLHHAQNVQNNPSLHQSITCLFAKQLLSAFDSFFSTIKNAAPFIEKGEVHLAWRQLNEDYEIHELGSHFQDSLIYFSYLFYQETTGKLLELPKDHIAKRLNDSAEKLHAFV